MCKKNVIVSALLYHCLLQCTRIYYLLILVFISYLYHLLSIAIIIPSHSHHTLLHATASLIPPQVGSCSAPNPVLYYKVMTPQWLEDHASLSQLIATTPENLHFKVNQAHRRLIKVPLFQSGELPTDDITVTITIQYAS